MATKKTVQFDENYGRIKVNFAATLDRTEHKCKSVPVFFYSKLREKARNMQSLNFWACDINRKSGL